MVVPWAATQLDGENRKSRVGCALLLGSAALLYDDPGSVGRTSGRTIRLPVAVTIVKGERYLVSMLGENVQWVHNVRAAGGRAVFHRHGREEVHLEEVPAEQRAPILKAYLKLAPGARPHVPVHQAAPLAQFEQIATAFPVFRVVKDMHAPAGRSVHDARQQEHRS